MRIDPDCIRDILLTIEKNSTFENPCNIRFAKSRNSNLEKYNADKFFYHIRYLKMKNLIFNPDNAHDEYNVDLTPSGHDYLNSIRNSDQT